MIGETDKKDKEESRKILLAIGIVLVVAIIGIVFLLPSVAEIISTSVAPGLGLRAAAILSFFITLILMVVLAIAAGDGFLGEIQFMIGGFFGFFLVIWILLAWIF
jgi:hypothetical protein